MGRVYKWVVVYLKNKVILIVSMQFLQSLETFLFANILQLQNSTMESKFALTVAMLLKFILKEGFILMFLLLPITITQTLRQTIVFYAPSYDIAISVGTFVSIVVVVVPRINGMIECKIVKSLTLLLVPWVDILTFPVLMVLVLLVQSSRSPVLSALNIITAILFSITQLLYNLINFTKSPKSNNLFHCRQARMSLLSNCILLCFLYYILARWVVVGTFGSTETLIYNLLLFVLTSIKIKERVMLKYSIHPFAQSVTSFTFFLEFNLSVIAVVYSISQLEPIIVNLPFLVLVMTVLSYYAMVTYLTWRESEFYLSNASEMKEEEEVILYLDCLEELARKVENEVEDIILISLRTRHEMSCSNASCFCNTVGKELCEFMKEYIKCELNTLAEQFSNSPSVLISILYFKMVMFKFYPEILSKLNEYKNKFSLTLLDRFYCHWLTHFLKKYILKRNQEIAAVESEHMFRLEELREEIQTIIRNEVDMREKKWKYLSRGLCRIEELEEQCEAELNYIQRMLRIYEENSGKFKKSKEFNLLMLFYFLKVSFLNNGKDIKANLKEIYYGFKLDELRSLKEFKKFIFHKSSCAVETMVDTKSMGTITLVSRNVEDLFGVPQEKVKGTSINSLMPDFMGKEHQKIMERWSKTGNWTTIGKLKEVFCVHKEQYCFSALIYLKIYVRDNSLYFITNIFKLNDADYMILSPEGRIQGQGRKFMKVLGEQAKYLPINVLIENAGPHPEKEQFQMDKPIRRVFMGLKGLQDKAAEFLQEESSLAEVGEKEKLAADFYRVLKSTGSCKYFVEFVVQTYQMGSISFPVIQIRESRVIEKHKTIYFLNHAYSGISSMREHLGEEVEVDMESSRNSEASKEENDDDGGFEHMANSSMASTSEKENYPLSKMVDKFVELLMNPNLLTDHKIYRFTLLFVILASILGLLNFVSYFLYRSLLLEVEGVFFADGAVSDIMQTTQIAYAHVYQLRSQLLTGKFTDFQSQIRSARYVQHYVQGLKEYSFAHLLTDRTSFSHKKMYDYIERSATWIQNNTSVQMDTYQFLEQMYYLTAEMVNQLEQLKASGKTEIDTIDLERMVKNFPEMQALNDYYLEDYYQNSISSSEYLNNLTIGSMVLFAVITLVVALAINSYFKFRFFQAESSFKFLSLIPNQLVERMKDYYLQLARKVLDTNLLKNIDQHEDEIFSIDTHDIGKVDLSKISSVSKIKLINYSTYYRWIVIALLLLAINGFNYLATHNVRVIFDPSKTVMELVNALMRGENRLLQTYFDLKADYYLDNPQGLTVQFFDKVQKHLDGAGQKWSSYANQLSTLLLYYSPEYQEEFKAALTTNICELTVQVLPDSENSKCRAELELNMLDGGIMIAMNFFRRTVQEAIASLKAQYVTKSYPAYEGDYFLQLDFTELDKMEIYMFKIYQLTQSICYDAFTQIIDSITSTFLVFAIIFLLVYACCVFLWCITLKGEKKKLSRIYARLILVPFGILKSNARIVNSFKEATEYAEGC